MDTNEHESSLLITALIDVPVPPQPAPAGTPLSQAPDASTQHHNAALAAPASPTDATAEQPVPTAWRGLFWHHADAAVYLGLFSACRAGRDAALHNAPRLTVRLEPPASRDSQALSAWQARLVAVQEILRARGGRPTGLTLVCHGGQLSWPAFRDAVDTLREAPITELQISPAQNSQVSESTTLKAFLRRAATAWPQLSTLRINACFVRLPEPSQLQSLSQLHLSALVGNLSQWEVCEHSIAALLPQLTALTLNAHQLSYTRIFTHTSHTLAEYTTNKPLCATLLKSLLENAPNLQRLCVRGLHESLSDRGFAAVSWAVGTLELRTEGVGYSYGGLLGCLPRRREGRLQIVVKALVIWVETQEGLAPEVASRLCEYTFDTPRIAFRPSFSIHHNLHSSALYGLLEQLTNLHTTPNTLLELSWWFWSLNMLLYDTPDALTQLSQSRPDLKFKIKFTGRLTDYCLRGALRMAQQVRQLEANDLNLNSGDHVTAPWPWEELAVETVDAAMLLKLPHPRSASGGVRPCVRVRSFDFSRVPEDHHAQLREWLTHVQWQPFDGCDPKSIMEDVPDTLRDCIQWHTQAQG